MQWKKSSRSQASGGCVEVMRWIKSSRSQANGGCVETAAVDQAILMRDSKDPHGPRLAFAPREWNTFLDSLKHGEFDPA